MTNAELGGYVAELADLMALDGADRRRVAHYRRAATVIRRFDHSLAGLIEGGTDLSRVPGVGKGLAAFLGDLVRDGMSPRLERYRERVPAGLPGVLRLDGVGVTKARALWAGGIDSVEKLGEALATGELRGVHGFGPAVVGRVRKGLAEMAALSGKALLSQADRVAEMVPNGCGGWGCWWRWRVICGGAWRSWAWLTLYVAPKRKTYGRKRLPLSGRPCRAGAGPTRLNFLSMAYVAGYGPCRREWPVPLLTT